MLMYKTRLLALSLLAVIGTACAATAARSTVERPSAMQSYVWYDGDTPRRVWLDPEVIAEFGPPERPASRSAVRSAVPQAHELPSNQAGVRLWRVPDQASETARSLRAAQPQAEVSPVLRDAPTEDAPMRALPGNVVVHLDPSWSQQQARDWLRNEGLEVVRKLGFGRNIFLVRSEPGLASLELANDLREKDGVAAAMPDWWEQVEPR
jgi:hypothetical protein